MGMLYATKLAVEMCLTNNTIYERQRSLFTKWDYLSPGLVAGDIMSLYTDKKTVAGRLRFILPLNWW